MANTFLRKSSRGIGNVATAVGNYTVDANLGAVVLGLSVSNTTSTEVYANISINNGADDFYLVKYAPIPDGSTLVVVGGDQKVILQPGDSIKVESTADNSLDSMMSIMETNSIGFTVDPTPPPPPLAFDGVFDTTPIGIMPTAAGDLQGYMDEVYIAFSGGTNVYFTTTTLGSSWTQRSFPASTTTRAYGGPRGVFANSKFYVTLFNSILNQHQLYSTVDFIDWSVVISNFSSGTGQFRLFATNGTKTYAGVWFNASTPSDAWLTNDGLTWTFDSENFPGRRPNNSSSVAWGEGNDLVAASDLFGNSIISGMYYSSNAGDTWIKTSDVGSRSHVAFGNGTYVAISAASEFSNVVLTSNTGTSWTSNTVEVLTGFSFSSKVGHGSGVFLIADPTSSETNVAYISSDGVTWIPCTAMPENFLKAIHLNDKWVLYSQNFGGNIYSY